MKLKTAQTLALTLLALSGAAMAQDAAPAAAAPAAAAEPQSTLAFNIGAVSDYRYRGLTQTRFSPTVQGGVDYTDKSGFYVGAWASGIKWIRDAGASGSTELDLYGGYRGNITPDVAFDVGYLRYEYVGNTMANVTGANANTDELYGALTYNVFTLKYSRSMSNLFGTANSTGSGYLDLSANFDLGNGWSLTPHIGHQTIANSSAYNYSDYSLTLGKDFGHGLSASAALVGTNADKALYTLSSTGDFLGKSGLVLGVKYAF